MAEYDPEDSYDATLRTPEPELSLPEDTKQETDAKIKAEQNKVDKLQEAIDYDIGHDGTNETIVTGIGVKHGTGAETMFESMYDSKLKTKRDALAADLARLRKKYLDVVDQNIKDTTQKQKESISYDSLILSAARSTRSYLQGRKKRLRSKSAGQKSEFSGSQPA